MMEIALPLVDEPGTRPGSTPVPRPARREKGWVRLLLSTTMGTLAVFVAACSSAPTSKAPERMDRQVASRSAAGATVNSSSRKAFSQSGKVSWYGREHAGKLTANGERFNPKHMTAAHRTLPFGTMVRVTRLDNGRSVVVRINDRGPFIKGRIVDVSQAAAKELDLIVKGVAPCKVEVVRSKVSSAPESEGDRSPGIGTAAGTSSQKGRVVAQVRPSDF